MTKRKRYALLFTVLTFITPPAFSFLFSGEINVMNITRDDASFVLRNASSGRTWGRSLDSEQSTLVPQEDATEFYFSTQLNDQLCIMCSSSIEPDQSIATIVLDPAGKDKFSCLMITSTGQTKRIIGKHTENRLPDCAAL